jgi:VWFA-related protein
MYFHRWCSVWAASLLLACCTLAHGQQTGQTIRLKSTEVLVPTLVEKHSGEILYGLGPGDFQLSDNGVPQAVHVDDDLDSQPVALVVAIEMGRMSALEFAKISGLSSLMDVFLGDGKSQAAVVTFDSAPHTATSFTTDSGQIAQAVSSLQPGDGGAAILDAIGYSVNLLENQPQNFRRVLLLISETRDHGSHRVDPEHLVQQIGSSNTLVLSVAFSSSKSLWLRDLKSGGQGAGLGDLVTPLVSAVQGVRRNVAREVAAMSGGEYTTFTSAKAFEASVLEMSKHARNRYLLSFRPTDKTPGLHMLDVRLTRSYKARVVSRQSYWVSEDR